MGYALLVACDGDEGADEQIVISWSAAFMTRKENIPTTHIKRWFLYRWLDEVHRDTADCNHAMPLVLTCRLTVRETGTAIGHFGAGRAEAPIACSEIRQSPRQRILATSAEASDSQFTSVKTLEPSDI